MVIDFTIAQVKYSKSSSSGQGIKGTHKIATAYII